MIIEYFGLPGSGKSYNMERAYNSSVLKKYNLTNKFYSFSGKLCRKFSSIIFALSIKYNHIKKELDNCLAKYNCSLKKIEKKDLIFKLYMYLKYQNKSNVYIDEGIVQSIVFASNDMPFSNVVCDLISSLSIKNIKFVFISTDVDKSIENIINRNRHICEFDDVEEKELRNCLKDKYLKFENIYLDLKNNQYNVERI